MMGIDERRLTLRHYQAVLGEWNRRHDPNGSSSSAAPQDMSRLKRAMAAQTCH